MNKVQAFFNREHGLASDQSYDFALKRLCVAREDSWRGIQPSQFSSDYNPEPPIFAAKFANCDGYRHILAIANEDGKIALQDTTKRNYELEEQTLAAPQCHFNAVFDLEWAPKKMQFVSASGDHTARLWEVTNSKLVEVSNFVGHSRSVKTATFRKNDASVFATGGRDGAIIIWDTRARLNLDRTPRADNCIRSGHTGGPGTPVSQKKRTRTPKLTTGTTSSSITGLAFQDEHTLISCGAGDGVIKVWDLRRNYSTYKKEPLPKHSLPYAGTSTFRGFTNLTINEAGTHLFANCMDNTIYCYNICSYAAKPMARYKGLYNSTFYIKSCLSPDFKYLLSGSSDEKAYIWNLNYPDEPLVALCGHSVEVTCVAWSSTHDRPIVTCSDDARHKIWRIGPDCISETERRDLYRGHAEYVRKFQKKPVMGSTHKYNLRDLESTPRSLKRLVEHNERTPSSMEKVSNKRSFLEMLSATTSHADASEDFPEQKRPKILESRGRRLFSPSTSTHNNTASCSSSSVSPTVRCLNIQLQAIPEENNSASTSLCISPISRHQICESNQENKLETASITNVPTNKSQSNPSSTPSPLSERTTIYGENQNYNCTSPLATASSTSSSNHPTQTAIALNNIFSPTSNLPNYVLDGEAPHLGIMSPKRKQKDKVDWLTNLRKQKLMSACRNVETTLTEKLHEAVALSPRLHHLRESSPRLHTPRRRNTERHHEQLASPTAEALPKTPTSSRRNSETSILRFFNIKNQSSAAPVNGSNQPSPECDLLNTGIRPRSPPPNSISNTNGCETILVNATESLHSSTISTSNLLSQQPTVIMDSFIQT